MKLKDIYNMEEYLQYECYCPGEIYSADGFFFQIFKADSKCKEIARFESNDNYFSKIPCVIVISRSEQDSNQILFIMHEDKKIEDVIRFDATENNIKLINEVVKTGKTELKLNEYTETKTKESLEKIFNIADAIMID